MLLCSRPRRIALALGLIVAFVAVTARAAETGNGSKNFNVPTSVPNYFSNESGPLLGPAAETRRGALYSNGVAEAPQPATAAVAEAPRARQHVAMAEPRGRLIRGRVTYSRRGHAVATHYAVAGHYAVAHGPTRRVVAHVARSGRVEHVVARTRAVAHRPTQISSAHRHARG